MSNSSSRVLSGSAVLLAWMVVVAGCGSDGARAFGEGGNGGGQSTATGGHGGQENGTGGAIASGGVTAPGTGGQTGSGGAIGTGGVGAGGTATGGHPGSGGRGGNGGKGGVGGSGGAIGSGGATGSGGAIGSGGMKGTGGTGGADAATCDQLASDYQKELTDAKTCSLVTTVPQCQISVSNSLSCGGCKVYVQTDTKLKEISNKWAQNGCSSIGYLCPAIACLIGSPGNCALSGSATIPQCQNSGLAQPATN